LPPSDLDVSIALQKGKRFCTDHPLYNFVFYDRITPSFCQFVLSLSSIFILRSYENALLVPTWKQVMNKEMDALISQETWELNSALKSVFVVGSHWFIL